MFERQCQDCICSKHSKEEFVCFCLNSECEVPLCSLCIQQHNREHHLNNTFPQYFDMRYSYLTVKKSLQDMINIVDDKCQKIETLMNKNAQNTQKMIIKLKKTKQQCLSIVNSYFDQQEKRLLTEIQSQLTICGVPTPKELEKIKIQLKKQIEILNNRKQDINQKNFPKFYPKIKILLFSQMETYHKTIDKTIQTSEEMSYTLDLDESIKVKLKQNLFDKQNLININSFNGKKSNLKRGKNVNKSQKQNKELHKNVIWASPLAKDVNLSQTSKESKPLTPNLSFTSRSPFYENYINQLRSYRNANEKNIEQNVLNASSSMALKNFAQKTIQLKYTNNEKEIPLLKFSKSNRNVKAFSFNNDQRSDYQQKKQDKKKERQHQNYTYRF